MSSATEQYLESKIASSETVDVPLMVDYLIQDSLQRGAGSIGRLAKEMVQTLSEVSV